ncbi:MAG: response regulator [Candidatus Omnitrophica bacterium]|nr:response regulator [Candidatus Omnitrophota bacterium]
MYKKTLLFKFICSFLIITFGWTSCFQSRAMAQVAMFMPPAGTMVKSSAVFNPALVRGIEIDTKNPLQMKFLIEAGDKPLTGSIQEDEYKKLVKYFLASLTVPENNQWVNLSPYENNRIIAQDFGQTEMGRDLLSQDYILKQLTASLMYPEDELGKKFWEKVYKEAAQKYGVTELPMNTFNKVWIVPQKAVVYEKDNVAWIVDSSLKVMLDKDYVALQKNKNNEAISANQMQASELDQSSTVTTQVVREIIIPALEKEVNSGEHFALLRQIYQSMILAAWYKRTLKQSLLGKIYADKTKVKGVDLTDKEANQKIYEQYLEAFKKGVYDYIKEEYDPTSQQVIPRKYFSGGVIGKMDNALLVKREDSLTARERELLEIYGTKRTIDEVGISLDRQRSRISQKPNGLELITRYSKMFESSGEEPRIQTELNALIPNEADRAMLEEILKTNDPELVRESVRKQLSEEPLAVVRTVLFSLDGMIIGACLAIDQESKKSEGKFVKDAQNKNKYYTFEQILNSPQLLSTAIAQHINETYQKNENKDDDFIIRALDKGINFNRTTRILAVLILFSAMNFFLYEGLTGRNPGRDIKKAASSLVRFMKTEGHNFVNHMAGVQDNKKLINELQTALNNGANKENEREIRAFINFLLKHPKVEVFFDLSANGRNVISGLVTDAKGKTDVEGTDLLRPVIQAGIFNDNAMLTAAPLKEGELAEAFKVLMRSPKAISGILESQVEFEIHIAGLDYNSAEEKQEQAVLAVAKRLREAKDKGEKIIVNYKTFNYGENPEDTEDLTLFGYMVVEEIVRLLEQDQAMLGKKGAFTPIKDETVKTLVDEVNKYLKPMVAAEAAKTGNVVALADATDSQIRAALIMQGGSSYISIGNIQKRLDSPEGKNLDSDSNVKFFMAIAEMTFKYIKATTAPKTPWLIGPKLAAAGAADRAMKVLVVDDNQFTRELYEMVLKDRGYEVVLASSPEEAEKIISDGAFKPELLFSDYNMKNKTGVQMIESIRKIPGMDAVKSIIISANAYTDEVKLAVSRAKIDGLVSKLDGINAIYAAVDPIAALFVQKKNESDSAQLKRDDVGGIDLNAAMLNMQIKRDGNGVPLPVEMQDINSIKIDGLSPYIIDIKPIAPSSLPIFSELMNDKAGSKA